MSGDIREFRWPSKRLLGDYVRGVLGVTFAIICALLAPPGSWWQIILIALLFLFLAFLSDVLIRHGTRIVLTPEGLVRRRPFWGQDKVDWIDIKGLDVKFYASGRDRTKGWMTATINGPEAKITLDDANAGFEDIVDRAMQALDDQGLGLNETTATNLASLGLGLRPKAGK